MVPIDLKTVTATFATGAKVSSDIQITKAQLEHAQLLVVDYPRAPSMRVLIPRPLFGFMQSVHCHTSSWITDFASPIPSGLASCIVQLKDLQQASANISACAQDKTLPYRNPATQVTFPAGMFNAVDAKAVLSSTGTYSDVPQMMKIYDAVKAAGPDISMDLTILPTPGGDFRLHIGGHTYNVETTDGNMVHTLCRPLRGAQRRLFHYEQTADYLWTGKDKVAYVIPFCVLPEHWYTSGSDTTRISLKQIEKYRIDLSKAQWVQNLARILTDNRSQVAKGPDKPRPIVQRMTQLEDADQTRRKRKFGNTTWLRHVCNTKKFCGPSTPRYADEIYRRLLTLCAQE